MPKVWKSMIYVCEDCGHKEKMFLEVGVGGPYEKNEMPCPFTIICPECGDLHMYHVDWYKDEELPLIREIGPDESYFKIDHETSCGMPVHNKTK